MMMMMMTAQYNNSSDWPVISSAERRGQFKHLTLSNLRLQLDEEASL